MLGALDELQRAERRAVGTKQTLRAIERGEAEAVFVARDAEPHITRSLLAACQERRLPVHQVESMEALGRCCGVEVGAAAAAILTRTPAPSRRRP